MVMRRARAFSLTFRAGLYPLIAGRRGAARRHATERPARAACWPTSRFRFSELRIGAMMCRRWCGRRRRASAATYGIAARRSFATVLSIYHLARAAHGIALSAMSVSAFGQ